MTHSLKSFPNPVQISKRIKLNTIELILLLSYHNTTKWIFKKKRKEWKIGDVYSNLYSIFVWIYIKGGIHLSYPSLLSEYSRYCAGIAKIFKLHFVGVNLLRNTIWPIMNYDAMHFLVETLAYSIRWMNALLIHTMRSHLILLITW